MDENEKLLFLTSSLNIDSVAATWTKGQPRQIHPLDIGGAHQALSNTD